jgi:glycine dehydrogenase subunit 1
MKFIPNLELKEEMLRDINIKKIDDLFSDIPEKIKIKELNLPKSISQQETEIKMRDIAKKNKSCNEFLCFIGGGIKNHYIPPIVKSIISRSEFYTSYTPYQAEASQGFLQAMFEYQSMIAELTGMDVSNCSLYDGVTSLSEAVLMCTRITKRNSFVISSNISWEKKSVLKNYILGSNINIKEVPFDEKTGKINIKNLKKNVNENTAGVYIENPNYFGIFEEDMECIHKIIKDASSLFVVGVDPLSLGITKPPGEYGADIVIGEGRVFGNPMDFGGCGLGIFSCKKDYVRQIPGRIIGLTTDNDGKRGFCMTLQTREQHIRREKATSNICTNEGLCSLSAVVYLSWLGSKGLYELAKKNLEKSHKLADMINKLDGFSMRFTGLHFNEFVIKCRNKPQNIIKKLLTKDIQIGPSLSQHFNNLSDCISVGVTESHTNEDMEKLVSNLREVR